MKEFSLDVILSCFNKVQLLFENSINVNDIMRKEMEFYVYIVEFFFFKNDYFYIELNKYKFFGFNLIFLFKV